VLTPVAIAPSPLGPADPVHKLTDQQRGLAVRFMPFAERVAKRRTLNSGEQADVRADALFGLVNAARRGTVGRPFAPYARACIEGQILRGKRDRSGIRSDRKAVRPRSVSFDALPGDVDPDSQLMSGGTPISPYQAAEDAELWRLVDALAPREGRAIRLYYQLDETQRTIASVLGVSQMEVSRILNRARASLRDLAASLPPTPLIAPPPNPGNLVASSK
jgi:RNA polymerase sigma factor (sigma-70 family)